MLNGTKSLLTKSSQSGWNQIENIFTMNEQRYSFISFSNGCSEPEKSINKRNYQKSMLGECEKLHSSLKQQPNWIIAIMGNFTWQIYLLRNNNGCFVTADINRSSRRPGFFLLLPHKYYCKVTRISGIKKCLEGFIFNFRSCWGIKLHFLTECIFSEIYWSTWLNVLMKQSAPF